jgi:nucleoside-diphosphate-sugar epimerase
MSHGRQLANNYHEENRRGMKTLPLNPTFFENFDGGKDISAEKAFPEPGWKPRVTLEEGLRETLE